ncbi:MFS general substrate transporter, partial [Aureobasidium melanogenum]
MYTPSSYSSSQSGKPPTWPMVPLSELDIKIPVRTSSLGPLLQPEPCLSSPSPDPSNLGHYNDGTLSRRSTVRGTVTFRSPDVSPKTQSPPSSSSIEKDKKNLERTVTGLHNLMEEALTVAQDAAQNNRSQEVAQILDEAKLALRKSSTIHGHMAPPLRIDDTESDEYFSSDEFDQGSDSDADIESNISSMQPKPKASNISIPAAYTKSKNGLSLEPAPIASVPSAVLPHSIRQRSVVHPILNPPFESDGKRPSSQEAVVGPSSSEDFSMTQTPPQMYSKLSAVSTMHDWAYAKRSSTRRDLRGGSEPGPVSQDETVLPPPAGESTGVVLPPVIPQDASVKTPEQIPHEPLRISIPDVPKRRSLRPVRSDPQLSSTPSPPPQPTVPYAVYDPRHYASPDYPSAQYLAANPPEIAGPASAPPKRWKPKVGASRIFESPYYHVPERREVPVALPASAQPPLSGQPAPPALLGQAPPANVPSPDLSLKHPRKNHISLKDEQGFRFHRYRRSPIAREWKIGRKRITAIIACLNTMLVGLIAGIYAGEVPKIQYKLGDEHHHVILGNVLLYFGIGITTLICWPLPLLHGRRPYTLAALAIAIPLQFPQSIATAFYRGPHLTRALVGLLVPRFFLGFALGFAHINFLSTLLDLFGASLQSRNPHQEIVVYDDVRRQGGGMGIWLGLWSWCFVGSLALGFLIGASITQHLAPSWGFYVCVILLSFFILVNVVAPETRRAPYRRSVLRYLDEDEKLKKRVARGEVKLHLDQDGPKYWYQEVWAGMRLMAHMFCQFGFFILAVYLAWIYALVVLVTLLLGALLSRNYGWQPQWIGLAVFAVAVGAALAVPLTKANVFSRDRVQPMRTDSGTFESRITWSSHLLRRCLFTFALPLAGLAYVLASPGPSVKPAGPTILAAIIGFFACLAMAECIGLAMEAFDTSDLQPGVNSRHRLASMESATRRRRTNYSSYPRVCAGIYAAQGLGFLIAAAATAVSGNVTRALGAQAATGVTVGILLGLTILLSLVMWRFRSVQVIPNGAFGSRGGGSIDAKADQDWKPVVIGNPSGKMRRMNLLEMGSFSRWTEIRKLNHLISDKKRYVG